MKILDGQRVVFLGDSITEADPGYTRLTAALLAAQYPERHIDFINAGISGHKVTDLLARVERDVLSQRPDWITISVGINDVWHAYLPGQTGVDLPAFQTNYRQLLDQIAKQSRAKIVLLTPTVIGEELDAAANRTLAPYADYIRFEAATRDLILCDMHAAFQQAIRSAAGRRPFTTDGVHLTDAGNALMALTLIQALQ